MKCANEDCGREIAGRRRQKYCSTTCCQEVYRRRNGIEPSQYGKRPVTSTNERFYSDEEAEFLKAVERYRREKNRPYPTCTEILSIAKALGYRKEHTPGGSA